MAVLFHNGNVTRHDSFGTALYKLEYFLLGGRVHIIKEYASNPSSLTTVLDIKVIITPRRNIRCLLTWSRVFKDMNRTTKSCMLQDRTREILTTGQFLQGWVPHCFPNCPEPGWCSITGKALPCHLQ